MITLEIRSIVFFFMLHFWKIAVYSFDLGQTNRTGRKGRNGTRHKGKEVGIKRWRENKEKKKKNNDPSIAWLENMNVICVISAIEERIFMHVLYARNLIYALLQGTSSMMYIVVKWI